VDEKPITDELYEIYKVQNAIFLYPDELQRAPWSVNPKKLKLPFF
jgi:hypothetical protein